MMGDMARVVTRTVGTRSGKELAKKDVGSSDLWVTT